MKEFNYTEEYTVEIYEEDGWLMQVDVFDTYDDAIEYTDENPLDEDKDLYYSIWCIEYDENGEEIDSYPVL